MYCVICENSPFKVKGVCQLAVTWWKACLNIPRQRGLTRLKKKKKLGPEFSHELMCLDSEHQKNGWHWIACEEQHSIYYSILHTAQDICADALGNWSAYECCPFYSAALQANYITYFWCTSYGVTSHLKWHFIICKCKNVHKKKWKPAFALYLYTTAIGTVYRFVLNKSVCLHHM